MVGGSVPFYLKFWVNRPPLERSDYFEPIFARSASAVTPSEKSSVKLKLKLKLKVHYVLWPSYPCKNDWWVAIPSTWNFGSNWSRWGESADVRSLFANSGSAVTLSEWSSINTSRKSRWTSYVVPMPPLPKGVLKNAQRPIFIKNRTSLEESLLHSCFVRKLSATQF